MVLEWREAIWLAGREYCRAGGREWRNGKVGGESLSNQLGGIYQTV